MPSLSALPPGLPSLGRSAPWSALAADARPPSHLTQPYPPLYIDFVGLDLL